MARFATRIQIDELEYTTEEDEAFGRLDSLVVARRRAEEDGQPDAYWRRAEATARRTSEVGCEWGWWVDESGSEASATSTRERFAELGVLQREEFTGTALGTPSPRRGDGGKSRAAIWTRTRRSGLVAPQTWRVGSRWGRGGVAAGGQACARRPCSAVAARTTHDHARRARRASAASRDPRGRGLATHGRPKRRRERRTTTGDRSRALYLSAG